MSLETATDADSQPRAPSGLFTLSTELLHEICGYFVAPLSGIPNSTGLHCDEIPDFPYEVGSSADVLHPFYALAATCHFFEGVVESYCQHLLLQYRNITAKNIFDDKGNVMVQASKKRKREQRTVYRVLWVKWTRRHCSFCGMRSVRRCIFNCLIRCCASCDSRRWPEKITMSAATKKYHLTKLDLFRPNLAPINFHIRPIRYATYNSCVRSDTTMFIEEDVARLAKMIHGEERAGRRRRQNRRARILKAMELEFIHGRRRAWVKSGAASETLDVTQLAKWIYNDIEALPEETDPAVKLVTFRRAEQYLASLTTENDYGRLPEDSKPAVFVSSILNFKCERILVQFDRK